MGGETTQEHLATKHALGQQFGNCRLIRRLGTGGFAEVYLAEHTYLKTSAAIKVLRTPVSSQETQNFVKEAHTLSLLNHPHILRVLDFGIEGTTPFLIMDYAPHGTLRQRCPQGHRLPQPVIISYVKQVAEALQYAHTNKVIHVTSSQKTCSWEETTRSCSATLALRLSHFSQDARYGRHPTLHGS